MTRLRASLPHPYIKKCPCSFGILGMYFIMNVDEVESSSEKQGANLEQPFALPSIQ